MNEETPTIESILNNNGEDTFKVDLSSEDLSETPKKRGRHKKDCTCSRCINKKTKSTKDLKQDEELLEQLEDYALVESLQLTSLYLVSATKDIRWLMPEEIAKRLSKSYVKAFRAFFPEIDERWFAVGNAFLATTQYVGGALFGKFTNPEAQKKFNFDWIKNIFKHYNDKEK